MAETPPAPGLVATIPPLAFILREVAGAATSVKALLDPGASPHTYEPRPSDVRAAQAAVALFYVADTLDGWATRLPSRRTVAVLDLVPPAFRRPFTNAERARDDGGEAVDPHFWTDPLTVQATLPALVEALAALDPAHGDAFRANAARFADALGRLHGEVAAALGPVTGTRVVLFHPSFGYLLARHGIDVAAVVEPLPGREPTARDVQALGATARRAGATVAFTEPQLPRRPAEVIAEVAHLRIAELDPLGGAPGRETYRDLVLYNARVLAGSLR